MVIKETIEDIELDALLSEEKESDTYVKKVVDKIDNGVALDGVSYKKIGGLKGESLSPDVSQWRKEHDKLAGEASKIRKVLVGGLGDKIKIAAALKELRTKISRLKALRKSINKNIGKTAAKPGELKVSRTRASAAEKTKTAKTAKKYEKMEKRSEWKRKVKGEIGRSLADFGAIKRGK